MNTTTIRSFSELNIKVDRPFVGKSIEIDNIIDKEIIVHDYKIGPSKYKERGNGRCLTLQIEFEGAKRVVFSGSGYMMDQIQEVSKENLPIVTTIIREFKSHKFT